MQFVPRVPSRFLTHRKTRGVPVILLRELPDVGLPGDLVAVKPGRARNHLVPKGFAVYASPDQLQRHQHLVSKSQTRFVEMRENAAQSAAEQLEEIQKLEETYHQRYRTALESFIANSRLKFR